MKVPGGRWRGAIFLSMALCVPASFLPAKAAEPRWPQGPYNYLVVDQDLRAVLEQFGRNMDLPVRVSDDIRPHRLRGKVGAPDAKAFLQWICDSYQLMWYFDGATLHVLPQSHAQNVYLELGPVLLDDLRRRLAGAGIADDRFPLVPTGDSAFVSLAAPPAYISVVHQVLASMKNAAEESHQASTTAARQDAPASPPEPAAVTEMTPPIPAAPVTPTHAAQPDSGIAKTQDRLSTVEKAGRQDQPAGDAAKEEKGRVLVFRGGY